MLVWGQGLLPCHQFGVDRFKKPFGLVIDFNRSGGPSFCRWNGSAFRFGVFVASKRKMVWRPIRKLMRCSVTAVLGMIRVVKLVFSRCLSIKVGLLALGFLGLPCDLLRVTGRPLGFIHSLAIGEMGMGNS